MVPGSVWRSSPDSLKGEWGFLFIDARNTLNGENRTSMLWAVRHEWPSGAQFTFNCYRHWATLVVRDIGDGSGHFLHSKEGVTQGDPLAMITYGIGVLPLIRELQDTHPRATQPWYADDTGAGTSPGLLCGADQEHLGRGPRERRTG